MGKTSPSNARIAGLVLGAVLSRSVVSSSL